MLFRSKHAIAVGILNRLNLHIEGSLGYFGCGLIDGPNVHIKGRVGWSCAENMLAGTIVIEKNAGSTFGAAIRGGDLVCKGDVGARMGIDQKGGTIIVGGRCGAFCGFMMQRGRMVILGDAGKNLGDSMYDGTIYVGGKIAGRTLSLPLGRLSRAAFRCVGVHASCTSIAIVSDDAAPPARARRGMSRSSTREHPVQYKCRASRAANVMQRARFAVERPGIIPELGIVTQMGIRSGQAVGTAASRGTARRRSRRR